MNLGLAPNDYNPHKVIPIQQGLKRRLSGSTKKGRSRSIPHKVIPIQQGLKRCYLLSTAFYSPTAS